MKCFNCGYSARAEQADTKCPVCNAGAPPETVAPVEEKANPVQEAADAQEEQPTPEITPEMQAG